MRQKQLLFKFISLALRNVSIFITLVVFYRIVDMLGNGLIAKLESNYLGFLKDTSCGDEIAGEAITLSLSDIWASLIVLPAGLGVALVILIWERTKVDGRRLSKQGDIRNNSSSINTTDSLCSVDYETHHSQLSTCVSTNPTQIQLSKIEATPSADHLDS